MKIYILTLAIMLSIFSINVSQAQTVTESWELGFGLSYPRLYSVNITSLNSDYGVYLSMQRNFSEHVGLRLKGGYSHMIGTWNDAAFNKITETTNLITGDLDLLFYLVPCAPVSPYLFAGVGLNYKMISNAQTLFPDDNKLGSQLNIGAGAEFKIDPEWSITTEFGYHVTNNSELEGTIVPAEINGHDTYLVLSAGVNYFFGRGEPSKQCEPCEGLRTDRDLTDYNKIEDMIIKHIPKEVVKQIVVKEAAEILAVSSDRLVLVGVNFAFDKSDLLPESYPVLDKAVRLLKDKSTVNVEIEGYTDYIGTEAYNQTLSLERANTVKQYLIANGIASNRLSTIGYGKNNPVENNNTEEGRAMNRRIVFRIK